MGSNAISLTTILRQLIDAGSYKNLPGGLRSKGLKTQNNDIDIVDPQFVEIDTGGGPIADSFLCLFHIPVLIILFINYLEERNQCKELGLIE